MSPPWASSSSGSSQARTGAPTRGSEAEPLTSCKRCTIQGKWRSWAVCGFPARRSADDPSWLMGRRSGDRPPTQPRTRTNPVQGVESMRNVVRNLTLTAFTTCVLSATQAFAQSGIKENLDLPFDALGENEEEEDAPEV